MKTNLRQHSCHLFSSLTNKLVGGKEISKVSVRKIEDVFQYRFEIAPQDGKRKYINKSGFKTKVEAERVGIKALNYYLETGHNFKPSEVSYSDYLDYRMQ